MDAGGALYGISAFGGPGNDGTVYKLTPPVSDGAPWTESVIWSFDGSVDGSGASDQMIFDASGNLNGASYLGGPYDDGVVWELTPPGVGSTTWTRTVLWSFNGAGGARVAADVAPAWYHRRHNEFWRTRLRDRLAARLVACRAPAFG